MGNVGREIWIEDEIGIGREELKSGFKSYTKRLYYFGEVYFYWAKIRRLGIYGGWVGGNPAMGFMFTLFSIGFYEL